MRQQRSRTVGAHLRPGPDLPSGPDRGGADGGPDHEGADLGALVRSAGTLPGAGVVSTSDVSTSKVAAPKAKGASRLDLVQRVALPVAWLILILGFGIANPSVFLTAATFQTMLGSQAVLLVLTLALIVPLTAGDYDLSVAGVLTLSAMMVAILNVQHGWPIWAAIVAALVMGLVVGLVNVLIMVFFGIESLIVTLGMGTLLTEITLWASDSATISGISQTLVDYVIVKRFAGISLAFFYAIALCALLWWVLEYTSVGRDRKRHV